MKTNTVIDTIISRRSCRAYSSALVEAGDLDAIVQAGIYAANGRGAQSSAIVLVTNKEIRDKLSRMNAAVMNSTADPFYGAPVVIAVLADSTVHTFVEDGALSIGSMMLAASSLGLGSCWIHRAREVFSSPEGRQLKKAWGLSDSYEGIGFCIVGHATALGKNYEHKAERIIKVQ